MPLFMSNGVAIAYITAGPLDNGKPPVLLIHGFASNVQTNWVSTGWIRDLNAAGYSVVAFDNRGHGLSQKLYGLDDYGAAQMADDASGLLAHLNIAQAHVMGYSMGARIAAFLAVKHRDQVASLVFGGMGLSMVRGMAGTGPVAHALEAAHIDDVTNATARTFRAFAEQTKSDLKALATCIRSARAPVTAEELKTIGCPVLVAVGSGDVIAGSAAGLAELIPGAVAYEIENRDHMKAVGDRAFKTRVLEFLSKAG